MIMIKITINYKHKDVIPKEMKRYTNRVENKIYYEIFIKQRRPNIIQTVSISSYLKECLGNEY